MKTIWETIKSKFHPPTAVAVVIVILMVLCSELLGEKEIIFPEMAALSIGYLVAPKRSWMVNGRRMLALITMCAVLGVMIVRYLPFDVLPEVILAFAFAQILFMYSGTTFAPFVSAIVLPVMLRTTTFVYPIAAALLTLTIILAHKFFLRIGMITDEAYVPTMLNSREDWVDAIIRIAVICVLAVPAFHFNMKYIIAPPLLVAFTEFSRPRNKTRNIPGKAVGLLTGCALIGSACREILNIQLGLSLTVTTAVTIFLVLYVVHDVKMFMPPAGALSILAMIIPENLVLVFTVQVFLGSVIIMAVSRLVFMRRQEKNDHELRIEYR